MVYEIGMFSLGFPEVLPPTIIMTMYICSMTYIHLLPPTIIQSISGCVFAHFAYIRYGGGSRVPDRNGKQRYGMGGGVWPQSVIVMPLSLNVMLPLGLVFALTLAPYVPE